MSQQIQRRSAGFEEGHCLSLESTAGGGLDTSVLPSHDYPERTPYSTFRGWDEGEGPVAFHHRASEKNGILNRNRSDRCLLIEASAQNEEGLLCDLLQPHSEFSAALTGSGRGASAACQWGCVASPCTLGAHPTPGQLNSFDKLAAVSFETSFKTSFLSN